MGFVNSVVGSVWEREGTNLQPLTNNILDQFSASRFQVVKYLVTMFNETEMANRYFELAIIKTSSSFKYSVSNKMFTPNASVVVVPDISSGTFTLFVQNNEQHVLRAEFARLILQ